MHDGRIRKTRTLNSKEHGKASIPYLKIVWPYAFPHLQKK
jgi:hypothetical protein